MAAFHLPAGACRADGPYDIFGDLVTILVAGEDTGGRFTLIHGVTPPQGGPPLHRHIADAEAFVVKRGRFVFVLDGERVEAGEGETVFIPAGIAHQYMNLGDEPGEVLLVVEPAGLDVFFARLHELLRSGQGHDFAAIASLHADFRMQLLGPPLAAQV